MLVTIASVLPAFGGCASAQPQERPPAARPSEPRRSAEVLVNDTGVHVRVAYERCKAGKQCPEVVDAAKLDNVETHLEFANGVVLTGKTDAFGYVGFHPEMLVLFQNAASPIGRVRVGDYTVSADLSPLIESWKRQHPSDWLAFTATKSASQGEADRSVTFPRTIYTDRSIHPLVNECQRSGAERCYDGIDNDCDGRYDDKDCGYASGSLQWTVTWPGQADIDLAVFGPDGLAVDREAPANREARLILDRECMGLRDGKSDCPSGNVENILVPSDQIPLSGTYQAELTVRRTHAAALGPSIPARLSGRIGARTWYVDVDLAPVEGANFRVAFPIGSDSDRDGVVDAHDSCPKERGCWFSELRHRGCPDVDGDNVPNSIDACPDKTGLTQAKKGVNGCPLVFGDAWVTNRGVMILKRIEFDTAKATLKDESTTIIQNVAAAIAARPGSVHKLAVDGHTDNVGDDTNNIGLSFRRAEAVRTELVRQGVDASLVTTRGFGETKPIADNDSEQGRQTNRRVEFVIVDPKERSPGCW